MEIEFSNVIGQDLMCVGEHYAVAWRISPEGGVHAVRGYNHKPRMMIGVGKVPAQHPRVKILVGENEYHRVWISVDLRVRAFRSENHFFRDALLALRQASRRIERNLRENFDVDLKFLVVILGQGLNRNHLLAHRDEIQCAAVMQFA